MYFLKYLSCNSTREFFNSNNNNNKIHFTTHFIYYDISKIIINKPPHLSSSSRHYNHSLYSTLQGHFPMYHIRIFIRSVELRNFIRNVNGRFRCVNELISLIPLKVFDKQYRWYELILTIHINWDVHYLFVFSSWTL